MTADKERNGRILIVDDNEDLLKAARIFLKRHFGQVDLEKNPEAIPTLLNNENYDVILLDMNFTRDVASGKEGFYWLDRILEIDPNAVVVLITAYGDVEMAVKAIKEGASDFVLKPWENERLLATLYSSMKLKETINEVQGLRKQQRQLQSKLNNQYHDIIGESDVIQKVFETIDRVADTDANILILGENGTGKELVAQAIHNSSSRNNSPFVSVDLGSISETLFESELFGHVKGAFTDARENRQGRFEMANTGTLFFDEIANLSTPLQAKLLTALQSRQVTRVGSNKSIEVDIRLICATNMPIYDLVKENRFRQDLLYRINTLEITLPPLRERVEDIPLLASSFLKTYAVKYRKNMHKISDGAFARMTKYHWPGNIRELQHAIERAVIMSSSSILQPEDLMLSQSQDREEDNVMLDQYDLEQVEKILIRKVLQKHNGNITQAAGELGLTRSSLYRRLEKYGI